jgi:hypothetical protein
MNKLIQKRPAMAVIRHWSINIGIALLSAILVLVFIEVIFRFVLAYSDIKTLLAFSDLAHTDRTTDPDQNITLRQMIRHSDNPRIIYELIPNLSVQFVNKRVTINSHGFRGLEYSRSEDKKTTRIVGLGDSNMFGWGVSDDEYFLVLLEKYLNQSTPFDSSWEVINMAVPGYNTVMEVEIFKGNGINYKPDIVVISYVMNDFDLPNFIREEEDYFSFRRSFAVEYFSNRLMNRSRTLKDDFIDAPRNVSRNGFESDPSRVPSRYKNMVGPDAYRSAMQELKLLSIKHNFQLLVFTTYFPEDVKEILRELDLPMLESGHAFTEYLHRHGIKEYVGSPLSVGLQDPHPSALGHIIMADTLYNYLKDSKMLRQIYQRRRIMSSSN